MNILRVDKLDNANGEGLRTVVWVAGCKHKCKGCHNPESWNFQAGTPMTKELMDKIVESVKNIYCKGLTISGGDPLDVQNIPDTLRLAKRVKEETGKTVWVYTGAVLDELIPYLSLYQMTVIPKYIDVIIDGEFKEELKVRGKFCGSSNQRLINVKETFKRKEVTEYEINS